MARAQKTRPTQIISNVQKSKLKEKAFAFALEKVEQTVLNLRLLTPSIYYSFLYFAESLFNFSLFSNYDNYLFAACFIVILIFNLPLFLSFA